MVGNRSRTLLAATLIAAVLNACGEGGTAAQLAKTKRYGHRTDVPFEVNYFERVSSENSSYPEELAVGDRIKIVYFDKTYAARTMAAYRAVVSEVRSIMAPDIIVVDAGSSGEIKFKFNRQYLAYTVEGGNRHIAFRSEDRWKVLEISGNVIIIKL